MVTLTILGEYLFNSNKENGVVIKRVIYAKKKSLYSRLILYIKK